MEGSEQVLEQYIQVVSTDLMEALKESAKAHRISVEMEIALRLTAHMAEPELATDNNLFNRIMHRKFTHELATAECQRKREGNQYLFEIEKLRNYLYFAPGLPRHVKETFSVIDVKAETPRIQAEIDAENRKQEGIGDLQ